MISRRLVLYRMEECNLEERGQAAEEQTTRSHLVDGRSFVRKTAVYRQHHGEGPPRASDGDSCSYYFTEEDIEIYI